MFWFTNRSQVILITIGDEVTKQSTATATAVALSNVYKVIGFRPVWSTLYQKVIIRRLFEKIGFIRSST